MGFDLSLFKPSALAQKEKLDSLMAIGEVTQQYNITMTPEKAKYILDSSNSALKDMARIEFGESAAEKITRKFCSSPYASNYNFEKVVGEVLEIFFYAKNEIENYMSDDELIDYIYEEFNKVYHGSLKALPDCVERLIHKCNFKDCSKETQQTNDVSEEREDGGENDEQ